MMGAAGLGQQPPSALQSKSSTISSQYSSSSSSTGAWTNEEAASSAAAEAAAVASPAAAMLKQAVPVSSATVDSPVGYRRGSNPPQRSLDASLAILRKEMVSFVCILQMFSGSHFKRKYTGIFQVFSVGSGDQAL